MNSEETVTVVATVAEARGAGREVADTVVAAMVVATMVGAMVGDPISHVTPDQSCNT